MALGKIGSFKRSFARGPKSATGGKSQGVCYLCLAGRETQDPPILFEDFSRQAPWRATYLTELPWDRTPAVLEGLPWGPSSEGPCFFKHDFWHNWHNGVAKTFIASAFVVLNNAGLLMGRSIDARFQSLNEDYKGFCKKARISPYIREISRDTFGMESSQVFPKGTWNKAVVSTQLMLFLSDFCQRFVDGNTDDVLLLAIASLVCLALCLCSFCLLSFSIYKPRNRATCTWLFLLRICQAKATRLMNVVVSVFYSEGFWIPKRRARKLGEMLYEFLRCYQRCCAESLKRGLNRFSLTPKCHFLVHTAQQLLDEADLAEWCTNPIATGNQLQEDFIGRSARLSRRVHMGKVHQRTLERSLLAVFHSLHG